MGGWEGDSSSALCVEDSFFILIKTIKPTCRLLHTQIKTSGWGKYTDIFIRFRFSSLFFFLHYTGPGVLSNYSYKKLVIPVDVSVFQLEMVQLNFFFLQTDPIRKWLPIQLYSMMHSRIICKKTAWGSLVCHDEATCAWTEIVSGLQRGGDRGHLLSQNSSSLAFFSRVTFFDSSAIVEQQFLWLLWEKV